MPTPSKPTQSSPTEAVEKHQEITNSHWDDLLKFLNDQSLLDILRKKQEQNLLPDALGFNLFRLISETYHRENFHSDIICAMLDPDESHGAGHRHIHVLIAWLKTQRNLEGLDIFNFQDVEVTKEKSGRIDILIRSKHPKKTAIIFENKINGATDRRRQLPRYLDKLEKDGYKVIAIVYLTLNQPKDPDETNWLPAIGEKPSDHDRIYSKLIRVIAFSHIPLQSLMEWIQNCEISTDDSETKTAFRQYGQLIQHLGSRAMNEQLTGKLYEKVIKDDGFLINVNSLVEIMNDLPNYRASKIKNDFESICEPFLRIEISKNVAAFRNYKCSDDDYLTVEIRCDEKSSKIRIWDRSYKEHCMSRVDKAILDASLENILTKDVDDDSWIKNYYFPEDEINLNNDLREILKRLK